MDFDLIKNFPATLFPEDIGIHHSTDHICSDHIDCRNCLPPKHLAPIPNPPD